MTQITIDLSARYKSAFGLQASSQRPSAVTVSKEDKKFDFEFYEKGKNDFEDISFKYQDKKVTFAGVPFLKVGTVKDSGVLAPPPMLFFSRQKKHIITDLNGGADEVIERWSTKQYNVRIRGILIDLINHQYPEDKVSELNRFFEYNGVVDAVGTQFFDKSITNIYFKSIEFSGVRGFEDTIQFTLTARAIKPVGFSLENPF